ncbi:MAG TPA: OmpA family protein [Lacunisphaera sp.]|nr:OmpA family protein [Lacunisphaera sp.]
MKNISKLVGIALAAASLLLTACTKKPIRSPDQTAPMGPSTDSVNPDAVAMPGEGIGDLVRDPNAGKVEDNTKSVVDPVYFALDRFAVAQAERAKVEAAVKWLKDNPEKSLVLVGHCDWRGTAEYNLGLGENRANSVKRYMEYLGADAKRLETLSKGSTEAKQGGSEADWSKDRRVDFIELVKKQ